MKILHMVAAAALMMSTVAVPAMAQTKPTSNASQLGGATAPANGAGDPNPATPQGQISTTPVPAPTKFPKRATRASARKVTSPHSVTQPSTTPSTNPATTTPQ